MNNSSANIHNSISYRGTLSVTLNTKGHNSPFVFYNNGTKHLFDTITRALAGYDIVGATPRYLDIQYQESADVYRTALTNLITFTGIVYGEAAEASTNEGRLLLNAVVTNEDKQPLSSLTGPRLVIMDANKRVLAEITNGDIDSLWKAITDSTDALVEWELIFTN